MNDNPQQGCQPRVLAYSSLPSPCQGRSSVFVGCVLKNLQSCGNTAVSHIKGRVTRVCDCGLMPWLLKDSELSVCGREGISLPKIRPEP